MTQVEYGASTQEHNYTSPELGYTLTVRSGLEGEMRVVIVELDTFEALLSAAGFVKGAVE